MTSAITAPIAAIKGNALDDGPGIRTVLFFKGCPLDCLWCHNPETRSHKPELGFDADRCLDNCTACLEVCEPGALSKQPDIELDRKACTLCFACVPACPATVFEQVGTDYTVSQLMEILLRDKPFFDSSGGGLTLSGGEPTQHPDFCQALAQSCRQNNIPVLMQTAGLFAYKTIAGLLPLLDEIWFDLKLADAKECQQYCGVSHKVIHQNFRSLSRDAADLGITLRPRTPLVPGITDAASNLTAIAALIAECGHHSMELVPYNPLWPDKLTKLGADATDLFEHHDRWMSSDEMQACRQIVEACGIACTVA